VTRLVVGPFNRVEGDLEVTLDVADGRVRSAEVNSPLFRGFERILPGRDPHDALVFVPRICGICSVSQSSASAQALAAASGVTPPKNGRIAANLVLAAENLADHLTHFYLFFMPDFARDAYRARPWHRTIHDRFKAIEGGAAREVLPARAEFLKLMGFLAGRWPHTGSIQPGGTAQPVGAAQRLRMLALLRSFRAWLEATLFGDALEAVDAIDSVAALDAWRERRGGGDFGRFLAVARDLDLAALGRATDRFLSVGNYPQEGGRMFAAGVYDGALEPFDPGLVTEDLTHAWMSATEAVEHPSSGTTSPDPDKAGAYTWCKAPRWKGEVAETGALARQTVDGHPLARDLVARSGGNVESRVVARLLEIARVVPAMERWVLELSPGEPFCAHLPMPADATSVGLVESARGALGHWLDLKGGRIHRYQIVAPTTWNFSPRDRDGKPGALEQALVGAPVGENERVPLAVQHIVRSFDPCMVCTVH
jgi:hydrogenase large subunit